MQKFLLISCFCFFSTLINAQSDFLLLKKGSKTIMTFYNGYYITFRTNDKEWVNAYVNEIANDSLYLKPYILISYMNGWGMPATDTMWQNKRTISIKNISAFPRKDQSVNYIKNGNIFMIGSGGYILLNSINTLSSNKALFEKNNGRNLGIAAAVFAAGLLIHTTRSPYLPVGRRYRLKYVKLSGPPS